MAAQLCGTGIAIPHDSWDTKQPLNINDDDIWPGMTGAPEERKGATEMTFCLVRTELGKFHQRVKPASAVKDDRDASELVKALDEVERLIEDKYLRHCNAFEPMDFMAMGMARGVLTTSRLRLRLPGLKSNTSFPESERRDLFRSAFRMLENYASPNFDGVRARFQWHVSGLTPGDAIVWVLNELRHRQPFVNPRQTWPLVRKVYQKQPDLWALNRALHIAIAKLTLKAWNSNPIPPEQEARLEREFVESLHVVCRKREMQTSRRGGSNGPSLSSNSISPPDGSMVNHAAQSFNTTSDSFDPVLNDDFSSGTIDWTFWDHLKKNPDALYNIPFNDDAAQVGDE